MVSDGRSGPGLPDGGTAGDGHGSGDGGGIVLVADDDEDLAETVEIWLTEQWDVSLAHDGDEALETYGPHVDVVLLDRRMPTMSGDEVLPKLREREGEARVAMMTAVDPDWDVVEMPFDMYLTKPLGRAELVDAVEQLFARTQHAREVQALFALSSKLGALQTRYADPVLESDERYQRLQDEFERLHRQSRVHLADLDPEEFRRLVQIVQ